MHPDGHGEMLLNHQPFVNDLAGYVALRDTVWDVFQHAEVAGVDFAGEATGWYWFHTFYALAHDEELNGLDLHLSLFNPRLTHAFKKAMTSRDHSDPKDARWSPNAPALLAPRIPRSWMTPG